MPIISETKQEQSDHTDHTFPEMVIAISKAYLEDPRLAEIKKHDIDALLEKIKTIRGVREWVRMLSSNDIAFRHNCFFRILSAYVENKIAPEDFIQLIRIWCMVEDIKNAVYTRNKNRYLNVNITTANIFFRYADKKGYPQADLIRKSTSLALGKNPNSCLSQCVTLLETGPPERFLDAPNLYIQPAFSTSAGNVRICFLPERLKQELRHHFARGKPIQPYFYIGDEDLSIDVMVTDYLNARHVVQIKPIIADPKAKLIADTNYLTRAVFTTHDEFHVIARSALPDKYKNFLISLFERVKQELSIQKAFSLLDFPLLSILDDAQLFGKLRDVGDEFDKEFVSVFVLNLFLEIHGIRENGEIILYAGRFVKERTDQSIVNYKSLSLAIKEKFNKMISDLRGEHISYIYFSLFFVKLLEWYLDDKITFDAANEINYKIKGFTPLTPKALEVLFLVEPPEGIDKLFGKVGIESVGLFSSLDVPVYQPYADQGPQLLIGGNDYTITFNKFGVRFELVLDAPYLNAELEVSLSGRGALSFSASDKTYFRMLVKKIGGEFACAMDLKTKSNPNLVKKLLLPMVEKAVLEGNALTEEVELAKKKFAGALHKLLTANQNVAVLANSSQSFFSRQRGRAESYYRYFKELRGSRAPSK